MIQRAFTCLLLCCRPGHRFRVGLGIGLGASRAPGRPRQAAGAGDQPMGQCQQHFRRRPRRPFFLPAGPQERTAHRLFGDSEFPGGDLLGPVGAGVSVLHGAQRVHHLPLRRGPVLDQPPDQPEHGLGIGAGLGPRRPASGAIPRGRRRRAATRPPRSRRRPRPAGRGRPRPWHGPPPAGPPRRRVRSLPGGWPAAAGPLGPRRFPRTSGRCAGRAGRSPPLRPARSTTPWTSSPTERSKRPAVERPPSSARSPGTRSTSVLLPRWSMVITYIGQP